MKRTMLGFTTRCFLAAALAAAPLGLSAQTTNKAPKNPVEKTADSEKPAKGGPFHGKLAAVDKIAKTITVGKRTFQVTSESKLKKAGKPATLEDGVVGETVSGYFKPAQDGKLIATTVNFGPKIAAQSGEQPKSSTAKDQK